MIRTLTGTLIPRTLMVVGTLALMSVLFAVWSEPAHASTFAVDSTADTNLTACDDAIPNDCTLRGAINLANANAGADTINFASGISTITLTATGTGDNNNGSGDLDITDDLTINGGSSGVIIEGGPSWNERVIDIIGATTSGVSTEVTMTDVTIQKGNATILPGTFDSTRGGGIRVNGGNNTHANGASLTLQRSTVTNNTAFDGGGILDAFRSTIVLQDSTVSDNTGSAGVGGITGGDPLSLTNSTVTGNTGVSLGSGIFIGADTATIVDSTVSDNNTVSDGGNTNGGGIYISTLGLVTLTGSTVSGNTAQGGTSTSGLGGGIYIDSGTVAVANSTVSSNTAQGGTSTGAGKGGGIYRNGGALALSNSTVAFNTATLTGGVFSTDRGSFTFSNTILAKNNAILERDLSGLFTSEGYNLLGEYSGSGLAPTDIVNPSPSLGPLADNGGPTKTHALLDGSPAIDAGNPATPGSGSPACESTDQRGVTRPQGTTCDIGAFEKAAGGGSGDTTPPTVFSVDPPNGKTGVPRTNNITVTFSEAMKTSTLNDDTVKLVKAGTTTSIPVTMTTSTDSSGRTVLTLDPFGSTTQKLGKKTTYKLTVEGAADADGFAVEDSAGNELAADYVSSFKTKRK